MRFVEGKISERIEQRPPGVSLIPEQLKGEGEEWHVEQMGEAKVKELRDGRLTPGRWPCCKKQDAIALSRFVEDIVRIIAGELMEDKKIIWFSVKSIDFESIHNHNAYAFLKRDK